MVKQNRNWQSNCWALHWSPVIPFHIQLFQLWGRAVCQCSHVLLSACLSFPSNPLQFGLIAMQPESFGPCSPRHSGGSCISMASCSTPAERLQPMAAVLQNAIIRPIFMAQTEQLNYRTGIGHSWRAGMLPGAKRWVLLLGMQSNRSECWTGWWILHPHTATKNPSLKQERKSKTLSKHPRAPVHLHRSIRASQKGFDCKGKSCACLLFPTLWYQSSSTQQCSESEPHLPPTA